MALGIRIVVMKRIVLLIFIFFSIFSYAQGADGFVFNEDSLGLKDKKGRKHGYSIRYLNENLKPCKLEKAQYYGYELFDHGNRVQKFYYQRFKRGSTLKSILNDSSGTSPMLLDGTVEWYKKNGKIISQEIFKAG
ncbi:MAG: hypothetical protein JKX73_05225, partial [Flavobacteriales bacterium]|nr:hypothetical protein [Flavobacteriales bacterium]